jgi:two-component system, cell cycle sensor histidine kinase and response regulator CckA
MRIRERVLQRGIYRGALEVCGKDGRTFELDLAITGVRNHKARTAGLVCTGRDMTNQRELEVELSNVRRMDTMGTLAAGVAHDFNNLLMVISAHAELALHSARPEDPLRRSLQEILGASHRAAELTRQLLAFGRKQVQGFQLLSINSVVERTCQMLPRVIGEDVELRLALGTDIGQVRADEGEIEQVLLNLAVNALDAMPNGGELLIETESVYLDGRCVRKQPAIPAGEYILIAVTDSGQGIAPEHLPRIFEPFYTTKSEDKGTRLGLAMVDGIVRQSGGFIWVDSSPGVGSTFSIYFSVAERMEHEVSGLSPAEVAVPRGSETVLVVEDEDALRESSVEFLSSIGYKVLSASDGEEALDRIREHAGEIDLVITDVVMPRTGGPKLAEVLVSLKLQVKVLFVSGYSENVVRRKGLTDTTGRFLQKPFSLHVLALKIRAILEEPKVVRAAAAGRG